MRLPEVVGDQLEDLRPLGAGRGRPRVPGSRTERRQQPIFSILQGSSASWEMLKGRGAH